MANLNCPRLITGYEKRLVQQYDTPDSTTDHHLHFSDEDESSDESDGKQEIVGKAYNDNELFLAVRQNSRVNFMPANRVHKKYPQATIKYYTKLLNDNHLL
ncbi:unnamed protein product [Didymodactylos carnosus]|uniref:Uncharacterized protein n=1 Tax=Didymodactylos carnosus TaxID=1234261 RepID=A0A814D339_9BILA|nr:unnamed protein product [Didymodactylos carnosus]CAF0950226.1 unnamed protein product [Didymodactylos carnosus]CAF3708214.1 unnamed protein product [Didymodactylos carnosus]CAF3725910.1 unnamed protein product [Didymodactylos carnosus]